MSGTNRCRSYDSYMIYNMSYIHRYNNNNVYFIMYSDIPNSQVNKSGEAWVVELFSVRAVSL